MAEKKKLDLRLSMPPGLVSKIAQRTLESGGFDEAARALQEQALWRPGDNIPGKGIFFGVWEPKDESSAGLGKIFNVFAAPEDAEDEEGQKILNFPEALQVLSSLKIWHGHALGAYSRAEDLHAALKDGSYSGAWFMPPLDLLAGVDSAGRAVQVDCLYTHKGKGALQATFPSEEDAINAYWSCSSSKDFFGNVFATVSFGSGKREWNEGRGWRMLCRPVRAEPRL